MSDICFSSLEEASRTVINRLGGCPCCQHIDQLICHLGSMANPTLANSAQGSEVMDISIMMQILKIIETYPIRKAILVGENTIFNSFFHSLLDMLAKHDVAITLYTELPILKAAGFTDVSAMLASYKVHVIAHIPTLDEFNISGWGGYEAMKRSIAALQNLNSLGYGLEQDLPLSVVYFIPNNCADPAAITPEKINDWLEERLAVTVNQVKVLNARPGLGMGPAFDEPEYLQRLSNLYSQFSDRQLGRLQCQHSLCVTWNGIFYDCQSNAMMEQPLSGNLPRHILSFDEVLNRREINISHNCLACLTENGASLISEEE